MTSRLQRGRAAVREHDRRSEANDRKGSQWQQRQVVPETLEDRILGPKPDWTQDPEPVTQVTFQREQHVPDDGIRRGPVPPPDRLPQPGRVQAAGIDYRFDDRPVDQSQLVAMNTVRQAAKEFARIVALTAPLPEERDFAMAKIEEAVFWANTAIARNR